VPAEARDADFRPHTGGPLPVCRTGAELKQQGYQTDMIGEMAAEGTRPLANPTSRMHLSSYKKHCTHKGSKCVSASYTSPFRAQ